MPKRHHSTLFAGASLAALVLSTAASAQSNGVDETDRIIVTATKRATTIQDVPFSINAQTQEDIDRIGAGSLDDIARNVAGLTIQNLGPGQSQVAIRGVASGQIVRDQPGVKEQVGVYLDESVISLSLFTPDLDLFDLNRVETLRGPQGTLFGSGSVGGTIRYITNQPELGVDEGLVEVNLNAVSEGSPGGHVKASYNAALSDKVAARVVGYHTKYGGFIDALTRDGVEEDVNEGNRTGGRLAVTFAPNEQLTITPRVIYQKISTDGFNREERFNIFANPDTLGTTTLGEREQFLLLREGFEDNTFIADTVVEYDAGFATLTSVTSYSDRDILVSRDASALTHSVSLDLGLDLAVTDIPSNLRDTTDYRSFTQEVRLASNGDGPLQWLGGVFYADIERDYAQRLPTPGYDPFVDAALGDGTSAAVANGFPLNSPFNSDLEVPLEQIAVFGEASYDVSDRLTVTAGGRYYDFEESRTISSGGLFANGDSNLTDETSSDGFSPRVLASLDLSDTVTLNAQASKGFRLGGVNDPLNPALCSDEDRAIFGGFQSYDDETLWNYEAGVKADNGTVTFNGAVFYNDISDLQVTLDAGSCSSRVVFNVPEAHTVGVEGELGFSPTEGLDLFLSASFIEAEFDSTVTTGDGTVLAGLESGNRLPTVPEFQMAASGIYSWAAPWLGDGAEAFVSGAVQHVGTRFTQPGDQTEGGGLPSATGLAFGGFDGTENPQVLAGDLELDSYTLLNLRTGFDVDDWGVALYVNNVTDENALFSFDRERGGRARLGYRVGNPRTFGVTARKAF